MRKKIKLLFLLYFVFIAFSLNSESIVITWNQEALQLIQENKTPPTIAARALAIVHTGMFNAWAAYDNKAVGTRRGGTLRRPPSEFSEANKAEAISFAAFRTLVDLFPANQLQLQNFMISLGYDPTDTSLNPNSPIGIGNIVAFDEIQFRAYDGANQLGNEPRSNGLPYSDYTGYMPTNSPTVLVDPNLWQPLLVKNVQQVFLTPQWGFVVPFALTAPNEFSPGRTPILYPSKKYTAQSKAILKLSAELNDFTKSVATYWADGAGTVTPPGHWNLFAQVISARDHLNLDQDIKLFFALDNAMLDSSIAAWYYKLFYNSIRPISAIHFLFNNQLVLAWAGPGLGTQEILGQNWQPYLSPTPPFPEFVSGHSTFSAAGAEVLKLFTGSNRFDYSVVIPQGSSLVEPGIVPSKNITLFWKTFTQAANQAGISRRYAGIHFKNGDFGGRKLGKQIGKNAFEKAQTFIDGTATVEHRRCAQIHHDSFE